MEILTDAVFRYHPYGEILPTKFNLTTGRLTLDPNLIHFNCSENVEINVNNYTVGYENTVKLSSLICELLKDANVYVAINYNNIGAVLIGRKFWKAYLFATGTYQFSGMTGNILKLPEVELVGIKRTKALTHSYTQNIACIVKDKETGITRSSKKDYIVDFDYDIFTGYDKLSALTILEAFSNKSVYGIAIKDNKPVIIGVRGERLKEVSTW